MAGTTGGTGGAGRGGAGAGGAASPGGGGAGAGASTGGTAGSGGIPGATPVWAPFGTVKDCGIERLGNPHDVPSFVWGPCPDASDAACEEAVFSPLGGLRNGNDAIAGGVHDDGQVVRVHTKERDDSVVVFSDEQGATLEAFRSKTPKTCALWTGSLWSQRYGVAVGTYDVGITDGGVVGRFGDSPVVFQIDPLSGGGPQGYEMGASRWTWWWQPQGMVSVSALDGSGFTQFSFAKASTGPVFAASNPVSAGSSFLSVEYVLKGDHAAPHIVISDGLAPTQDFVPVAADGEDANPAFADSHVAWFRGYGRKDLNVYEKVEIWASPWAEQGASLTPYKVADFPNNWNETTVYAFRGGWGRLAYAKGGFYNPDNTLAPSYLAVLDLASGKQTDYPLPTNVGVARVMGVTRTHAWAMAANAKPGYPQRLFRWKL